MAAETAGAGVLMSPEIGRLDAYGIVPQKASVTHLAAPELGSHTQLQPHVSSIVHAQLPAGRSPPGGGEEPATKRRKSFTAEFKLQVVREALLRPESNRIKPICRLYTQVTPVQLRKWIRKKELLEQAKPTARALPVARRAPVAQPRARKATAASSTHHPLASLAAAVSLPQSPPKQEMAMGEASSFGAEGYGAALLVASCLRAETKAQGVQGHKALSSHYLAAGSCSMAYSAMAMREEELLATQELLQLHAAPRAGEA